MSSGERIGPGYRLLDRYELVRYIDSGAAGTVWEARDHTLGQTVALKHVAFPATTAAQQEEADENRARTLREARVAARLRGHPRVVSIYDVAEVAGDLWLVLEYLPSRSLRAVLAEEGPLPVDRVARIGGAVAAALAHAHDAGITHRDVKPGNVLLGDDGRTIKLTDFGIAHAEQEVGLTRSGIVSGTPAYMSPEQARGDECAPASDVFSLGATLYRAVEGTPPFGEDEVYVRLMHRVAYGVMTPPRAAGRFTPLLMQLLELDPSTRPDAGTAGRLLDAYVRATSDPTDDPTAATPPGHARESATTPSSTSTSTPAASSVPTPATPPPASPPPVPPASRRWSGPRARWLAAAAVVVVLLIGSGVAVVASGALDRDLAELPDSVGAVATAGDLATADPCALVDAATMSRFGPARIGPGGNIGECRVTVQTANGGQGRTDVHFSSAATERIDAVGAPRDLGGLSIVTEGITGQGCSTYLRFPDGTAVAVQTAGGPYGVVPDRCAINDVAVAVAANRLAENGITFRPGWQGRISLAGRNACAAAVPVAGVVPDLDVLRTTGYVNGSNCYLGRAVRGSPYANVQLALEPSGSFSNYGTATEVGGKAVYTRGVQGYQNPIACRVTVVHKPSYDLGASGPAEAVTAQVEGAQAYPEQCREATDLALAVERNVT